jgi:hypothetical protein
MQAVQEAQVGLVGKQVIPGFTVSLADNFQYKDLKENAITRNQVRSASLSQITITQHSHAIFTSLRLLPTTRAFASCSATALASCSA